MKTVFRRLKQPRPPMNRTDYTLWRHRFLLRRLELANWIAIGVIVGFSILYLTVIYPIASTAEQSIYTIFLKEPSTHIRITVFQLVGLGLSLLLLRSPQVQQRWRWTVFVFLCFPGAILLLPQVQASFQGNLTLDLPGLILTFLTQAILMPVCWRLHLVSQLIVGGYTTLGLLFGLTVPKIPPDLTTVIYSIVGFYTVVVYIVADVGVFLYERLLRREFDLRQRLQMFLHAVSHDLRNPVLGTLMVLKNLRSPTGDSVTLPSKVLTQMIDSGDRQLQLINTLLEAHAARTKGIIIHPQPLDLSDLVRSLVTSLQPFLEEMNATLICKIPEDLPTIQADELQLRRVYENLIVNALRNNLPGLTLTLTITPKPKVLFCTVEDDGKGIEPSVRDRLFDPYTRGLSSRQPLGLGLGLYICQQIIEAHQGTIGVKSEPGLGACFWFTLPLSQVTVDDLEMRAID